MRPLNTPTQALASHLLGRPVRDWIAEQRELGWSWRKIAADLDTATGGQVVVTHEALRGWYEEVVA